MRLIIFDTETTGLPNSSEDLKTQPYVCQFAAMIVEYNASAGTFEEVEKIDQLVRPEIPIPLMATSIHGITDEMVAEAPVFAEVADTFIDAFQTADVAVAHNLPFDQRIIEIELARMGRAKQFLPSQTFDTMTETRDLCQFPGRNGNFRAPRLMDLYQFLFEERFDRAHNALNDVRATARCVEALAEKGIFQAEEPSQGAMF